MTLDSLKPSEGSKHKKKRVGRGPGSGHGKTACRGTKGQKSRSGVSIPPGFQGGQMPLYRQLPKRGFKNPFRKSFGVVNVESIAKIDYDGVIDIDVLKSKGLVKKREKYVKLLGNGEITKAVQIKVHAISKTAKEKIEGAGGSVELIQVK
ncbi:MAG: 50S ribosomal protein L15 [Thermodesulfobacteria bacterium]|nr:50S ribosomal protein L15 [Thermodesulfobacteriota bacterium]